jgi:hypothetical protein
MNIKHMLLKTLACSALLLGSSAVPAAMITLNGTNVSFTYDDSIPSFFGTPMVSGDAIYFTPTNFKAISLNGAGSVITSSTFNIVVTAHQGVTMGALNLQERGDYSLSGNGSSVDLGGQLRAFDISNPLNVEDSSFITTSSDLTLNHGNWVGTAGINLGTAQWLNATSINMTLENILTATTIDFPSAAFIEKKFVGVGITVGSVPPSEVPVPTAAWLFGSGLVAMVGIARRQNGQRKNMIL